jgi:hypothetical protein
VEELSEKQREHLKKELAVIRKEHRGFEGRPIFGSVRGVPDVLHLLKINLPSHLFKDFFSFVHANDPAWTAERLEACLKRVDALAHLADDFRAQFINFARVHFARLDAKQLHRSLQTAKAKNSATQQERRLLGGHGKLALEHAGALMDCFAFQCDNERVQLLAVVHQVSAHLLYDIFDRVHRQNYDDVPAGDRAKFFEDTQQVCNAWHVLVILFLGASQAMRPTAVAISEVGAMAEEFCSETMGLGLLAASTEHVEKMHQTMRRTLIARTTRKEGDVLQALRTLSLGAVREWSWPLRKTREYTAREKKVKGGAKRPALPSFSVAAEAAAVDAPDYVLSIYAALRERKLTAELSAIVHTKEAAVEVSGRQKKKQATKKNTGRVVNRT